MLGARIRYTRPLSRLTLLVFNVVEKKGTRREKALIAIGGLT